MDALEERRKWCWDKVLKARARRDRALVWTGNSIAGLLTDQGWAIGNVIRLQKRFYLFISIYIYLCFCHELKTLSNYILGQVCSRTGKVYERNYGITSGITGIDASSLIGAFTSKIQDSFRFLYWTVLCYNKHCYGQGTVIITMPFDPNRWTGCYLKVKLVIMTFTFTTYIWRQKRKPVSNFTTVVGRFFGTSLCYITTSASH